MRLFTAVDLSDEARGAIAAEQARLGRAMQRPSMRWVRPEHLHLTLVFIGEVPADRASSLVETIGHGIDQAPFAVALGGIGTFPPGRPPRILWLGVVEGARGVIDLERTVRERVVAIGVAVEGRAYHPHLTLARWRESHAADRRLPESPARVIARVDVSQVTLYESRLGSGGPTYTALAQAQLRG